MYWVKTFNRLMDKKAFFNNMEEVVDFLKKIKITSEKAEREFKKDELKRIETRLSAQEYEKMKQEINKWEGYDYQALVESIVIATIADDIKEAKFLLERE